MLDDLDSVEGDANPSLQRLRSQTYELVYGSDDELFHQALYDWYVSRGQQDRLLEVCTLMSILSDIDPNPLHPRLPGTPSHRICLPSQSSMAIPCQERKLSRSSACPPRARKLKFPSSSRGTNRISISSKEFMFRACGAGFAECIERAGYVDSGCS